MFVYSFFLMIFIQIQNHEVFVIYSLHVFIKLFLLTKLISTSLYLKSNIQLVIDK